MSGQLALVASPGGRVARHAGVNHGLLHRHFGSKDHLITEAIEVGVASLMPGALAPQGFDVDRVVDVMHRDPVPARLIARTLVDDIPIGSVRLHFCDGKNPPGLWTSDPGLFKEGNSHHITAIVDGGPNIITFLVDGKLCDGGESRQYGWGRFDPQLGDINGSETLRLLPSFSGSIQNLRIYDRLLRTSEAVANHQAEVKHGRIASIDFEDIRVRDKFPVENNVYY